MPDIQLNQNMTPNVYNDIERMVIERVNDKSDFVIMRVNPQRISIRRQKVIQRIQTSNRWVFQHWGAEPITVSYNGVTGYINAAGTNYIDRNSYVDIHESTQTTSPSPVSPYDTSAYQALSRLREFYETPHDQLQGQDLTNISGRNIDDNLKKLSLNLYYRDTLFTGYLTRMEIQEEENNPWMWSYTMEFIAYKNQTSPYIGYGYDGKKVEDMIKAMKERIVPDPAYTNANKDYPGITRTAQTVTPASWSNAVGNPSTGLQDYVEVTEVTRTQQSYQTATGATPTLPRDKENAT